MSTNQFAFMEEPSDPPASAGADSVWWAVALLGIKRSAVRLLAPLKAALPPDPTHQVIDRLARAKTAGLHWENSGIGGPGLTPATFRLPEFSHEIVESTLDDILEPDDKIPPDHFMDIGKQVRLLSRLARAGQWKAIRILNGEGFPADAVAEYEANHLRDTPKEGSRSLTLSNIMDGLNESGH